MQQSDQLPTNSHLGPGYDFITAPGEPQKKRLFPGGGNKLVLIIVVLAAITLLVLVIGLVSNRGRGDVQNLVSAAKQQNELIRITDIGIQKARGQKAKNIAVTTKLSLQSQQADLQDAVKSQGYKLTAKELAAGADKEATQKLTTAEQNNQFDRIFMEVLQQKLDEYQATLKKVYDSTKSSKLKGALAEQYRSAELLANKASTLED